jgi:hypothetical protein
VTDHTQTGKSSHLPNPRVKATDSESAGTQSSLAAFAVAPGPLLEQRKDIDMHVIKRNGKPERVRFDKITSRVSKLAYGLNAQFVDPVLVAQKCVKGVFNGVTTAELDSLAAETAVSTPSHYPLVMILPACWLKFAVRSQAYMTMEHPDYSILAARIAVSNLHKMTKKVGNPCSQN